MRNWIDCCEGSAERHGDRLLRLQHGLVGIANELHQIDPMMAAALDSVVEQLEGMIAADEAKTAARRAEDERLDRERYGNDI